jgi:hypothetical protein
MARSGKDHFGIAIAGFEHTLRGMGKGKEVKPLTPKQRMELDLKAVKDKIAAEKEWEEKEKARKKELAEKPRFGNMWRAQYEEQQKQFEHEKIHGKPRAHKEREEEVIDDSIQIIEALYGANGNTINIADRVRNGKKVNNRLAGQDPVPGVKKELFIRATVDGVEVEKTFIEGSKIELR